jgi:hypothetical protein
VRRLLARELSTLQSLPSHPCVVEFLDAFMGSGSGRPHMVSERRLVRNATQCQVVGAASPHRVGWQRMPR